MQNTTSTEAHHHLRAIQELASDLLIDFPSVQFIYERELQALQRDAKLRDFLPLLTSRQVRVLLSEASPRDCIPSPATDKPTFPPLIHPVVTERT